MSFWMSDSWDGKKWYIKIINCINLITNPVEDNASTGYFCLEWLKLSFK